MVAAGIEHARKNGARRLEACPIDLSRDSRSLGLFVGSTRVFEKAGFAPAVTRKAGPAADAAGALAHRTEARVSAAKNGKPILG